MLGNATYYITDMELAETSAEPTTQSVFCEIPSISIQAGREEFALPHLCLGLPADSHFAYMSRGLGR